MRLLLSSFTGLREVFVVGEILKTTVFHELMSYLPDTTSFVNLFGLSECQCTCTYKLDHPKDATIDSSSVPIGRSLPERKIMLLDDHEQEITAVDVIGELHVAGKRGGSRL